MSGAKEHFQTQELDLLQSSQHGFGQTDRLVLGVAGELAWARAHSQQTPGHSYLLCRVRQIEEKRDDQTVPDSLMAVDWPW